MSYYTHTAAFYFNGIGCNEGQLERLMERKEELGAYSLLTLKESDCDVFIDIMPYFTGIQALHCARPQQKYSRFGYTVYYSDSYQPRSMFPTNLGLDMWPQLRSINFVQWSKMERVIIQNMGQQLDSLELREVGDDLCQYLSLCTQLCKLTFMSSMADSGKGSFGEIIACASSLPSLQQLTWRKSILSLSPEVLQTLPAWATLEVLQVIPPKADLAFYEWLGTRLPNLKTLELVAMPCTLYRSTWQPLGLQLVKMTSLTELIIKSKTKTGIGSTSEFEEMFLEVCQSLPK